MHILGKRWQILEKIKHHVVWQTEQSLQALPHSGEQKGTEEAKHPPVFSYLRTTDPFLRSLSPGNPSSCSPRAGSRDCSRAESWLQRSGLCGRHRLLGVQPGTARNGRGTAICSGNCSLRSCQGSRLPPTPEQGLIFLKGSCLLESSDSLKAPFLPSNPHHLSRERKHSMDEQAPADGSRNLPHCCDGPQGVIDPRLLHTHTRGLKDP